MNRWRKGFTLVEIMVAMSILTVMTVLMYQSMTNGLDFWEVMSVRSELQSSGQKLMNDMVDDLRMATRTAGATPPNAVIPAAPNNSAIQFYLPADIDGNGYIVDNVGATEWDMGTALGYTFNAAANELERSVGGTTSVVAVHVANVTFEDRTIDPALNADEVRIEIILQKNTRRQRAVTETFSGVVQLRN